MSARNLALTSYQTIDISRLRQFALRDHYPRSLVQLFSFLLIHLIPA